ncbi:hypothetical protein DMP15_01060 [Pseudonocardia sp. UM4_GMWB1]
MQRGRARLMAPLNLNVDTSNRASDQDVRRSSAGKRLLLSRFIPDCVSGSAELVLLASMLSTLATRQVMLSAAIKVNDNPALSWGPLVQLL